MALAGHEHPNWINPQGTHNGAMAKFPLRVKRRNGKGLVSEVLCDTANGARDAAKLLRQMGYTDVWIEDADGRPLDETTLTAF
jgi:hypothetical protein